MRNAVDQSLELFALRRAELVKILQQLAPEDWQRQGIHEVHGAVTLRTMLNRLVEHEEEHCAQLESLVREGVG